MGISDQSFALAQHLSNRHSLLSLGLPFVVESNYSDLIKSDTICRNPDSTYYNRQ